MIFVRCDKCKEEISNTDRVYNIELTERETDTGETTADNLYGRGGSIKKLTRSLICRRCFEKYVKELGVEE